MLPITAAQASVFVVTYTGTVANSNDSINFFGLGTGNALDGQGFTARYTYDTAIGNLVTGPDYQQLNSGSDSFAPISVTATLTINGHTANFYGDYIGLAYTDSLRLAQEKAEDIDPPTGVDSLIYNFALITGAPDTLDVPVPLTDVIAGGNFYLEHLVDQTVTTFASGDLDAETYEVTAGGAPEPATWALMLVGFGGLGAAMRSRRRTTQDC
jgi:hypothetical protein